LTVASTTMVTNLNSDYLDGMQATSANTATTVVSRDASGNFSAGTVTASLSGNFNNTSIYTSPTNLNTLNSGYGLTSDTGDMWINYRGYADGFTYFRDFRVGNGKGTSIALFTGSTGNLTISGSTTSNNFAASSTAAGTVRFNWWHR
jgi:hypothetical protein